MPASELNLSKKPSALKLESYFVKGLCWTEYLQQCSKNMERMEHIYSLTKIDDTTQEVIRALTPLKVLCISEDWCPDCVQNSALIARLADQITGVDLTFFFRDQNPDLMAQYLTNGKKVIPAIVFFDTNFHELGRWSGPSQSARKWIREKLLKGRQISEIPIEELQDFDRLYDEKFLSEFWRDTLEEIRNILKNHCHYCLPTSDGNTPNSLRKHLEK